MANVNWQEVGKKALLLLRAKFERFTVQATSNQDWKGSLPFCSNPRPSRSIKGGYHPAPVVRSREVRKPIFIEPACVPQGTPPPVKESSFNPYSSVGLNMRRIVLHLLPRLKVRQSVIRLLRQQESARPSFALYGPFLPEEVQGMWRIPFALPVQVKRYAPLASRLHTSPSFPVLPPSKGAFIGPFLPLVGEVKYDSPSHPIVASHVRRDVTEETQLPLLRFLLARDYRLGEKVQPKLETDDTEPTRREAFIQARSEGYLSWVPADLRDEKARKDARDAAVEDWAEERPSSSDVIMPFSYIHAELKISAVNRMQKGILSRTGKWALAPKEYWEAESRGEDVAGRVLARAWEMAMGVTSKIVQKPGQRKIEHPLVKMHNALQAPAWDNDGNELDRDEKILRYLKGMVARCCQEDHLHTKTAVMPRRSAGGCWAGYAVLHGYTDANGNYHPEKEGGAGADQITTAPYYEVLLGQLDMDGKIWFNAKIAGHTYSEIEVLTKWSKDTLRRVEADVMQRLSKWLWEVEEQAEDKTKYSTEVESAKELAGTFARMMKQADEKAAKVEERRRKNAEAARAKRARDRATEGKEVRKYSKK